jgi:SecD/SecF fusion protein
MLGASVTKEQFIETNLASSQKVGPSIADDIKRQALWAVIAALVAIFLYIVVRFKNWRFGLGGVVSLLHDALVVIGSFSLFYSIMPFTMEIDQAFIAAILTVLGYSINDTVIVYDRIREYIGLHPKWNMKQVMNGAMNSTLGRTMNTSLTTLVVIVAIFIFGGEVIRGFIFALLVGIGTGTYSSVFIATPVVYDTLKNKEEAGNALKGIRRE